jgi:uncharacterized protein
MRPLKWIAALLALSFTAATAQHNEADVIVVGAGIAGLSAALEAANHNASVLVIDQASVFGGHAVMSGGHVAIVDTPLQRARGIHDSAAIAERDFVRWGGDPDRAWVRRYATRSREEIYDWLVANGVRFDDVVHYAGNSVARQHVTHGAGLGLVAPLYRACLRRGVRFRWLTKVNELTTLHAGAVILATGGFQSNVAMVRANWPKSLPVPERILAGSGINSLGSGLELARRAGAAITRLDHQWNYETGIPDPRYPGANRGVNGSAPGAIWINRDGKRFVDESQPRPVRLRAVLRQPGGTYWQLFGRAGREGFWITGTDWTRPKIDALVAAQAERGPRIDALARKYGLKDPPFYAMQFFPLARKSMGGVRIDVDGRVLDTRGRPVPHLFAAGEVTGFGGINGSAALEGTFLGPCILGGRVAARSAVASLRSHVALAPLPARPLPSFAQPCTRCHALSSPDPARWHFTRVHAQPGVCTSCHKTHAIDRMAQSEVCVRCHGADG